MLPGKYHMNSFSIILSSLRREKRQSQRHVASELGVSQALLSHYENGAREPKLDFVIKACDYFDVTADYILGRSGERKMRLAITDEAISDMINELHSIKSSGEALLERIKQIR